jgi:hypothetical protein
VVASQRFSKHSNHLWRSIRQLGVTASPTTTCSTRSTQSLVVDDLGDDPDRWLVIGPDEAANLLELVVLVTAGGNELIIHAMPLRAAYRKLLEQ